MEPLKCDVPRARRARDLALMVAMCAALSGCGAAMREKQLTRIAKDWCQTIRASQVIPVYPLTEDVTPGDVYLVTTSIPNQARVYRERGFLPLDMHKVRLNIGASYPDFYNQSHGIGTRTDTPYHWIFPHDGEGDPSRHHAGSMLPAKPPELAEAESRAASGRAREHAMPTAFWQAPHAFFPTYSFEVSTQTGLNAAIPIQSVPVSMAWMNATRATGSVQLTDAYVYGVTEDHLDDVLRAWAAEHRESLIRLKQANTSPIFLRVVNRVYLIGAINVSLANATSGRADVGVGADVGTPGTATAGEMPGANEARLERLSEVASAGMPGVAVSFAYATKRDVVANEVFRRPLVVGFIALDYPILPDGDLGEAVATTKTLMGEYKAANAISGDATTQERRLYVAAIDSLDEAEADSVYANAAALLPRAFQTLYDERVARGESPSRAFKGAEAGYTTGASNQGRRAATLAALKKAWEALNG